MSAGVWGMVIVGLAALVAGAVFARDRWMAARGLGKIIVLGPVFEAVAIAIFATEHFTQARLLSGIVPRWLPGPLFWTYFFGVALMAAAISLAIWRCVRWSAPLLALFFLIIVATVDLPNLPKNLHERLFWTLTVRETAFACGAMVLAGSLWRGTAAGSALIRIGRTILAPIFVFYAIEHFLFPRFVPGVPLEKLIPAGFPAPVLLSFILGIALLLAGIGLLIPRTVALATAGSGTLLLLLTVLFYLPIFLMETHTPLALEGINYVGDTLLFAATALLAGSDLLQPSAEPAPALATPAAQAGLPA
jgi:uncharacterized membrane protein